MNGNKIMSNLIWRFMERCGAQLVGFIVSVVLARILSPDHYGTIALVNVFITVLQTFVDSGMGNALIQKKDADDIDFSSVFYFNIAMCLLIYTALFFLAPYIAAFYEIKELTLIVRVISLKIIISGVKNVQQAYVSRNMMFKKFFYATLGGTLGAAVIGITLAYMGFGVWALVVQQLFNLFVDTIVLWITVKWRPKKVLSFVRLKGLISYGWKLLAVSLLNHVYDETRQLVIGKMYTPANLALYNKGKQFPDLFVKNINTSIDSVLLPAMSKEQDNASHVKAMTRRAIRISTFILAPFMIGLALVSKPVITLLLTEKWLGCAPFMVIFCVSFLLKPINTANLNAIKAMGRSGMFLKIDILKILVGIITLVIAVPYGTMAIAYSFLASTIISTIINIVPNIRLLNYSIAEQIKDLLNPIVPVMAMIVVVFSIGLLELSATLMLCIQVIIGVIIYVAVSFVTKNESFRYILLMLKGFLKKRG